MDRLEQIIANLDEESRIIGGASFDTALSDLAEYLLNPDITEESCLEVLAVSRSVRRAKRAYMEFKHKHSTCNS